MTAVPITQPTATNTPVRNKERIRFLDALRGLAILGILIMNIMGAVQPGVFYRNMNLQEALTGANYYAWIIAMVGVEGAMRGLFSVLFGAGALLLLDRLEDNKNAVEAADIYYRRVIWLIAFGLFNGFVLLWWGDILFFYGVIGLFLFPFRKMSARRLLIPLAVLLAFAVYAETREHNDKKAVIVKGRQAEQLQAAHATLTKDQSADLKKWQELREEQSSEGIMKQAKEVTEKMRHISIGAFISSTHKKVTLMESVFLYAHWYDAALFFFVGMFLYRSGFLSGDSPNIVYMLTAVVGITAGLWYNYVQARHLYDIKFDGIQYIEDMSALGLTQVRRVFQVTGYIGLLSLCYKNGVFRRLFNVLAPVGQMAFTNYLMQSVFMTVLALTLFGRLQRYEIFELALGFFVFQVLFSHLWLRYFYFGPCEWVWRSLTYLKNQPFKQLSTAPQLTVIVPLINSNG